MLPSESILSFPSKVTLEPIRILTSSPASDIGAMLNKAETLTASTWVNPSLSVTVNSIM